MNTTCGRLVDDVVIGENGLKLMSLIPELNAKEQGILLTLVNLMKDAGRLEIEPRIHQSGYSTHLDDQSKVETILSLYFPNGIQSKEYMWVGYLTRMHTDLLRGATDWSFDEGHDFGTPNYAQVGEPNEDHRELRGAKYPTYPTCSTSADDRHDTIPCPPLCEDGSDSHCTEEPQSDEPQFQLFRLLWDDPTLSAITANKLELANELCAKWGDVDLLGEVSRAAAWLRASPRKALPNGSRFLTNWVRRVSELESAGSRNNACGGL